MVKQIRVGVIGAGGMANGHHLPSLKKCAAADVTAVCDVRRQSAEETARRHGIPNVYTDYRELIANAPVDAVVIVTSNDQHAPMALAAIERGLHVLCEKPLALNATEAHEIANAARRAGIISAVNFSYRQNPASRFIRDVIEAGDLGTVYQISLQYLQGYLADPDFALPPQTAWRVQRRLAGLGVLGDLGSHLVDLSRFFLGEITGVQSIQRTFVKERPLEEGGTVAVDGDDVTMALLEFERGAIGTFQTSWSAMPWGNHQRVEIYGSKGAIVYENENQHAIQAVFGAPMAKYRALSTIAVPQRYHDTVTTHVQAFVESVQRGESYTPDFADGARAQEILDTIDRVAAEGARFRFE